MRAEALLLLTLSACGADATPREEPEPAVLLGPEIEGVGAGISEDGELVLHKHVPMEAPSPPVPSTTLAVTLLSDATRVERCDPDAPCRSVAAAGPLTDQAFAPIFAPPLDGEVRAVIHSDRSVDHARFIRVIDSLRTFGVTRYAISVNPEDPPPR